MLSACSPVTHFASRSAAADCSSACCFAASLLCSTCSAAVHSWCLIACGPIAAILVIMYVCRKPLQHVHGSTPQCMSGIVCNEMFFPAIHQCVVTLPADMTPLSCSHRSNIWAKKAYTLTCSLPSRRSAAFSW